VFARPPARRRTFTRPTARQIIVKKAADLKEKIKAAQLRAKHLQDFEKNLNQKKVMIDRAKLLSAQGY
jgi:hypothetical protein